MVDLVTAGPFTTRVNRPGLVNSHEKPSGGGRANTPMGFARNVTPQMSATGKRTPQGLQAVLPAAHARVGGTAMLATQPFLATSVRMS